MLRATDMLPNCLRQKIRPTLMWAPIPVLMPGERSSTECSESDCGRNCPRSIASPASSTSACLSVTSGPNPDPRRQWLLQALRPIINAKSCHQPGTAILGRARRL